MAGWAEPNQCDGPSVLCGTGVASVKEKAPGVGGCRGSLEPLGRLWDARGSVASGLGPPQRGLPSSAPQAGPFTARCFLDTGLRGERLPFGPPSDSSKGLLWGLWWCFLPVWKAVRHRLGV